MPCDQIAVISGIVNFILIAVGHIAVSRNAFTSVKSDEDLLEDAIVGSNQKQIERLLKKGVNVNKTDILGETPLSTACLRGNLTAARLLLENGARIERGRTSPIIGACQSGNRELVQLLLNRGVSGAGVDHIKDTKGERLLNTTDSDGCNLLFYAGSADIVSLLLERGLRLDATDRRKQTPLHRVASAEAARALIDQGANMAATDERGRSPLHIVIGMRYESRYEVIKELVFRGADVRATDNLNRTPLHSACSLEYKFAVHTVSLLLRWGSEINAQDRFGETPLHKACSESVERGVIELLLDRGADVNSKTRCKESPLHLCARTRSIRRNVIQLLLDRGGVDTINDRDGLGRTPLHLLIVSLLWRNSDGFATDGDCENGVEAVKLLVDWGANVNAKDCYGQTPLSLNYCKFVKCTAYSQVHNKKSSIQFAVMNVLLPSGADTNIVNDEGETILHVFCGRSGFTSQPNVRCAIQRGVILDATNTKGLTALHVAVESGEEDIACYLVEQGVTVDIQDGKGRTALHVACLKKQWKVARLLMKHGTMPAIKNHKGDCAADIVFMYDDAPFDLLYHALRDFPNRLDCIKGT